MNHRAGMLALAAGALLFAGCEEPQTAPAVSGAEQVDVTPLEHRAKDAGATASWNELATSLADRVAIDQGRLYAYLGMAQFRAAEAADDNDGRGRGHGGHRHGHHGRGEHLPVSAAIGGASAAVLNAFFPANTAEIEAAMDAQEAAAAAAGGEADDFAEAEALGRDVGAEVMVYAASDRIGLADPGTPPVGEGYWKWSGGPIVRGGYRARPFFLASDSQYRPAPPPPFGSPTYLAALAEVRQISDTRTADQVAIATFWNLQQSGRRNAVFNNKAVELIRKYHVSDARSARIMFLMGAAVFDASIACFDAKYAYWFIRPPQADPAITLPIGLPPHPSYPSAHSCVSGANSGILRAFFPREAASLDAMATEAGMSRLYGGIHYRFDMDQGVALGRKVAGRALRADLDEVAVLP